MWKKGGDDINSLICILTVQEIWNFIILIFFIFYLILIKFSLFISLELKHILKKN